MRIDESPGVIDARFHAEAIENELADAAQRPQISLEAGGLGAGDQQFDEFVAQGIVEFGPRAAAS